MNIRRISHVGIAVQKLAERIPFYRDVLGLPFLGEEEVIDQQVRVAFFTVGEIKIELLEATSESSPIAKFIATRGEGVHHIAYEVDDVAGSLTEMRKHHVQLIDDEPRDGAHGKMIAFLHPKSTFGVLTEFCQQKS